MLNSTILKILQPICRATGNVQLSIGVICRAMLAGFVMRTGTMYLTIILGDMKIYGPRP